ncbi:MAG: DNA polymerase III subunit delta' [Pseudomonadota bacterium]
MTPDKSIPEARGWSRLPTSLMWLLKTGKIPNALLLTGNPGSGRLSAAMETAMSLNCLTEQPLADRGKPCGTCLQCRKITSGSHPDIIEISPLKDRIRISQIREVFSQISVKPHEARWRMILIPNAGKMNSEAANALLKMLEEPPARTFFVLIAGALTDLLPTVISRCSHIRFKPISRDEVLEILTLEHGVDAREASVAASLADGSVETALKLINRLKTDPAVNWVGRRKWLIQETAHLTSRGKKPGRDTCRALPLAEQVSRETDLIADSLAIIRSWLRDLAVYRYSPTAIINSDFRELLEAQSRDVSLQRVMSWVDDLHTAEKGLLSNTVPRVTLEHFLLKLTSADN